MKTLPFFYSSRERNNISWYSDTDTLKKIHSKYNSDKAIECIKKHLSIVDNISLEEADNFLKLYSFDPFPSKLINSKNQLSLINYKKKLYYRT